VKRLRAAAHNRSEYKKLLGARWVDFESALKAGSLAESTGSSASVLGDKEAMLKQIQELLALIAIL